MTAQEQVEVGFFGVEPSTLMVKIIWSEDGCRRLHSHMAPHRLGWELPPSGWGPDIVPVFVPSCRKYVTIGDLLDNMSEDQRQSVAWANDNRDIIMAQLVWAQRGCELAHPGLWPHPDPYIHPEAPCIRDSFSLAEWGSDLSLIEVEDNGDIPSRQSDNDSDSDSDGYVDYSEQEMEFMPEQ